MYSSSCRRFADIILPMESQHVIFFLYESWRYSFSYRYYSSCGRAAAILLPMTISRKFSSYRKAGGSFFIWESCMYPSSFRRFAGNVLLVQKSCWHSSSCERAAAILLPVEELQVLFYLWKSSRYSC